MALLSYKPQQGYYTRTLSFVWFLTMVFALTGWIWLEMERIQENTIYWQAGFAATMALLFVPLLYWIINKPNIADFMIATEQEMKKVNWPSRKEIIGSTIVVIVGTLLIAALLFVVNLGFGFLFTEIGILNTSTDGA